MSALACLALLLSFPRATPAQIALTPAAARYAIVISIDGLMPASYTEADAHGLKIPTLRQLMSRGAWSPGVRGVMPAVTYPSHTSMVTGVSPRVHGIHTNAVFDPTGTRDGEWYWYEPEVRAPTLWQLAQARRLRTALIAWPATMGARGDAVVPEFWRGRGMDGAKLLRAISTPGLWDSVSRRFPEFEKGFATLPSKDESLTDIAVDVVERRRPNLLLLHLPGVDYAQHEHGPWSPEALAAIETADAQVARVAEAARHAGIWASTMLLVVSDHGFTRVEKAVRPGVLLRQRGLITVDEKNRVTSWRAGVAASSGSAYVYLHNPDDREVAAGVRELFDSLAAQPGSGIRRILSQDEIAALGGDADAFLALEPADGFALVGGVTGDAMGPAPTPGIHGFPPDREMMNASLIINGPGGRPGKIESARLVDIAPTVARWLGLRMEHVEGKPLIEAAAPHAPARPN
jgi:predicted AlkP superfamily pyrophosphatase or phosphodiesterase